MGIPVKVLPEYDSRCTQSAAEGGKSGKEGLVLLCRGLSDQSELRDSPSEDDLVNEGTETFALVGFRVVGLNKLHLQQATRVFGQYPKEPGDQVRKGDEVRSLPWLREFPAPCMLDSGAR